MVRGGLSTWLTAHRLFKPLEEPASCYRGKNVAPIWWGSQVNKSTLTNVQRQAPPILMSQNSERVHTHHTHRRMHPTHALHTRTTHTDPGFCQAGMETGREKAASLITPPLLEKILNYDIVTWGLADRLLQFSSTWHKSKASFLPSFFWILECRQQNFPSVNACV